MGKEAYYQRENLFFSTIRGSGVYEWTGEYAGGLGGAPIVEDVFDRRRYFLKRLRFPREKERYTEMILHPPKRGLMLWPKDMVSLEDREMDFCRAFLEPVYSDKPMPAGEGEPSPALLFPMEEARALEITLEEIIKKEPGELSQGWQSCRVRRMACSIVEALEALNAEGYINNHMHPARILLPEEGPRFDFSGLVYSVSDTMGGMADAKEGYYPLEFGDPYVVAKKGRGLVYRSQNYSLGALLFYLFFGRYAYDGKLLSGYVDTNIQQHYVKFSVYHKMPVFIFSKQDRQNEIGLFAEEERVISLWEDCPGDIKAILTDCLEGENALRRGKYPPATPEIWKQCFQSLGWDREAGKEEQWAGNTGLRRS